MWRPLAWESGSAEEILSTGVQLAGGWDQCGAPPAAYHPWRWGTGGPGAVPGRGFRTSSESPAAPPHPPAPTAAEYPYGPRTPTRPMATSFDLRGQVVPRAREHAGPCSGASDGQRPAPMSTGPEGFFLRRWADQHPEPPCSPAPPLTARMGQRPPCNSLGQTFRTVRPGSSSKSSSWVATAAS